MIAVKMIEMDPIESACLRPVTEARCAGSRGFADQRLPPELRTIAAMIGCYCEGHHDARAPLWPDCQGLLGYAALRRERCRCEAEKPVCARCREHCYHPPRRDQRRSV